MRLFGSGSAGRLTSLGGAAANSYGAILRRGDRLFDGRPTLLAGDIELFGNVRASRTAQRLEATASQVFGRELPPNVQVFLVDGGIQTSSGSAAGGSLSGATVVGENRTAVFLLESQMENPVLLADEVGDLLVTGSNSNFHHRVSFRMLDRAVRHWFSLTPEQQRQLLDSMAAAAPSVICLEEDCHVTKNGLTFAS